METALLLMGASLFLVCTILFLRHAFTNTIGWGVAGILFPPSALIFYAVTWKKLKPLALTHLASLCLLLLLTVIWVRAHPFAFDDSRLAVVRDAWAPAFAETPLIIDPLNYVSERELQPYLQGRNHPGGVVRGQAVEFVRATFVNNILRFKSDDNIFSRVEVAIPLDKIELKAGENSLEYTPESLDSPPVYLTYYPEGETDPEVRVYTHHFWLELMISVKDSIRYTGYLKLRLPDRDKSFVAGEYQAFTKDLRYEGDEIDLKFDSNATIEYVAQQYLVNKFGNKLEKVLGFKETFYQTALENPTGRTEVSVQLLDGSEHTFKMDLIKGEEGWVVTNGPSPDLISALQTISRQPPAAIMTKPLRERVQIVDVDDLDSLVGKSVVIFTRDGMQREGTISEVDQHNVTLSLPLDGGVLGMLVKRRDITEVKLNH